MGSLLFYSLAAYETGPVFAVISGNNKVNAPVNADNIADVGDAAFFDIIGDRDVKKLFSMFVYQLGSPKFINSLVKVF